MFSPGTKPRRDRASSPATPPSDLRRLSNRPSTGTPAPWAPRLSVLARVSQNDKADEIKPVYVGEFPQPLRDEQASSTVKKNCSFLTVSIFAASRFVLMFYVEILLISGDASSVSGGMKRGFSFGAFSLPLSVTEVAAGSAWMLRAVSWDDVRKEKAAKKRQCRSVGVVLCNRKTRAVVFWGDIYGERSGDSTVDSLASANDYHLHGHVDASLEKLKNAGAFERDRETNVFARLSKSIVDTLAKHWTSIQNFLSFLLSPNVMRSCVLDRLASLMLQLLKEASQIHMSAKSALYSHLELLAEVLLESYAGSVTAIVELGQENKGLMDEYWNRLLDSLYHQAKDFVEIGHENLNDGSDDINDELLGKLSSCLLPMAKRHECYSTLWKICCDINDSELLKNLMYDSMGPNGRFSYYVFKQLYARKQFSTLLRLVCICIPPDCFVLEYELCYWVKLPGLSIPKHCM